LRFLVELQRRNVHRAAVFYAGTAWLLVQVATQVFPFFDIPTSALRIIVIAVFIGFPFAMLFSWFYEWTPQGIHALASSRSTLGDVDAVIEPARRTLTIDPLNDTAYYFLSLFFTLQDRYEDLEAASRQALDLQPQSNFRRVQLATIQALRKKPEAIATAREVQDEYWRNYATGLAEDVTGDSASADAALDHLVACCADDGATQIASVYAARKDADRTFEYLDRALAARDPGITAVYSDLFIVAFQSDPRFAAFAVKAGLTPPTPSSRREPIP